MCGAFSIRINPFEAFRIADSLTATWQPIFAARPGEWLPIMTQAAPHRLTLAYWSFAPHWLKDPKGKFVINARAETIGEKPYFRTALAHHRCLIPADGFYEWSNSPAGRQPFYFTRRDQRPFFLAGVADELPDQSGNLGFAIITTTPNAVVAPVHDRMPVMLDEAQARLWVQSTAKPIDVLPCLRAYPEELMMKVKISKIINNPQAKGPEVIAPTAD